MSVTASAVSVSTRAATSSGRPGRRRVGVEIAHAAVQDLALVLGSEPAQHQLDQGGDGRRVVGHRVVGQPGVGRCRVVAHRLDLVAGSSRSRSAGPARDSPGRSLRGTRASRESGPASAVLVAVIDQ